MAWVVHDGAVVVGREILGVGGCAFSEIMLITRSYIFEVNGDPIVAVRATLLVEEAQIVQEFVLNVAHTTARAQILI